MEGWRLRVLDEDNEEEDKTGEDTSQFYRNEELEPLPEDNKPSYPQESKIYFASIMGIKNYVRNDEAALQVFHDIIDWVKTFRQKKILLFREIYSDDVYV
jgi:hypothetical protein